MLEGLYFPQSCRPIMLHFRVICAYLHIMSQILLQHFVPVRPRGQKHVPRDPKFVSRGCLSSRCLGIGPTPDFSAPHFVHSSGLLVPSPANSFQFRGVRTALSFGLGDHRDFFDALTISIRPLMVFFESLILCIWYFLISFDRFKHVALPSIYGVGRGVSPKYSHTHNR